MVVMVCLWLPTLRQLVATDAGTPGRRVLPFDVSQVSAQVAAQESARQFREVASESEQIVAAILATVSHGPPTAAAPVPPPIELSSVSTACADDAPGCDVFDSMYWAGWETPAPTYKSVPWPCRPGVDFVEDPTRWAIVTTDASPYSTWMSRANWHSWCGVIKAGQAKFGRNHAFPTYRQLYYTQQGAVGNPGGPVRDVFTGEPPEAIMPTFVWDERSPFHTERTRHFAVYSRCIILLKWMSQLPRNSTFWTAPNVSVGIFEPDMVWRPDYVPEAFEAIPGKVLGPFNDFVRPGSYFANTLLSDRHCKPKQQCDETVGIDIPWVFTRDDLWRTLPHWLLLTRSIRSDRHASVKRFNQWLADMFSMEFAALRNGIRTQVNPRIACHAVDSKPQPCNTTQIMHYTAYIGGEKKEGPYVFNKHRHHGKDAPPRWQDLLVDPRKCDAQLLRHEKPPCPGCDCRYLDVWTEFGNAISAGVKHYFHESLRIPAAAHPHAKDSHKK